MREYSPNLRVCKIFQIELIGKRRRVDLTLEEKRGNRFLIVRKLRLRDRRRPARINLFFILPGP
jgi:hypothetical protein